MRENDERKITIRRSRTKLAGFDRSEHCTTIRTLFLSSSRERATGEHGQWLGRARERVAGGGRRLGGPAADSGEVAVLHRDGGARGRGQGRPRAVRSRAHRARPRREVDGRRLDGASRGRRRGCRPPPCQWKARAGTRTASGGEAPSWPSSARSEGRRSRPLGARGGLAMAGMGASCLAAPARRVRGWGGYARSGSSSTCPGGHGTCRAPASSFLRGTRERVVWEGGE